MMEWTGERIIPEIMQRDPRDLQAHISRYLFSLQFCHNKTVLDAPCGTGYGTAMLSWVAEMVFGIDSDGPTIDYAQATYSTKRTNYRQGQAERLRSFDNDSFDTVVCFEGIEHIVDTASVINEFARVLKPDGVLLISAPEKSGSKFHVKDYTALELHALLVPTFKPLAYYGQACAMGECMCIGQMREDEPHPTHIYRAVKA